MFYTEYDVLGGLVISTIRLRLGKGDFVFGSVR